MSDMDLPGMWEAADFVDGEADAANKERRLREEAIRADERAKCRAELREKVDELATGPYGPARWMELRRWAREEAFGGE